MGFDRSQKLGTELFEFIETICANSGREGAVTG